MGGMELKEEVVGKLAGDVGAKEVALRPFEEESHGRQLAVTAGHVHRRVSIRIRQTQTDPAATNTIYID
jgi:hypothetical protein